MTIEAARPDMVGIWLTFGLLFLLPLFFIYYIRKAILPKAAEQKIAPKKRYYAKHYCAKHLELLRKGEFCVVVQVSGCDECKVFKIKGVK